MKKIKSIIKNENGAVSALVLFTVLMFIVILMSVYLTITTREKAQYKSDIRIKEIYAQDVDNIDDVYNELESGTGGSEAGTKETIPTKEDEVKTASGNEKGYVGYYADLNNDGKITLEDDGIIYADLAVGASGTWYGNSWSNYSYNAITSGLKQYYISSATTEVDPLKTGKGIIREVEGTSGTDRFYVMALEDFEKDGKNKFFWYYNANGKLDDTIGTSANDFGQGKTKTATEIGRWNSSYYGEQTTTASGKAYIDMWGAIQTKVSEGWFVPSKAEWSAFGDNLGVTTSNYANLGISDLYWSSSQYNSNYAYDQNYDYSCMDAKNVNFEVYVRLSATF